MNFRLVPKSVTLRMTLIGVMAVILRYFSEFAYLPGVLRKSSRSLSHLLMSSCLLSVQSELDFIAEHRAELEFGILYEN